MTEVPNSMYLSLQKMVGFASDGASTMVRVRGGLVTKLRREVKPLVAVHCIAYREALAVKDTCDQFEKYKCADQFANKVSEWLGDSSLRRDELRKLMDAFLTRQYEVIKIQGLRWL